MAIDVYKISEELKPDIMPPEEIEARMKYLRSFRAPDQVIVYLLAKLEDESICADYNRVHTSFFRLKNEYPEMLSGFVFTRGDIYPHSKELDRILFRLQNSGIIKSMNPSFDVYTFGAESKKIILSQLTEAFTDTEKAELENMTRMLQAWLTE